MPIPPQMVFPITNFYSSCKFKLFVDGSKYKLLQKIITDMCKGTNFDGYITSKSKPLGDDDEDWYEIDARVKSRFYSTSDFNLLQIISSDDYISKDLWDKLHDFFLNSKISRMLQLQEQSRH